MVHDAPKKQPHEFDFLSADARRVNADPMPVQRIHIELPDSRVLSALKYGTEAPKYIALHGAGLNAHSFDPVVFALGLPAIAIDLPGHGQSSWRDDADYSPTTIAADIASAFKAWTDTPVPLIGHSLGGLTALTLKGTHPDLVSKLVIIDITPTVTMSQAAAAVAEFITGQRSFSSIDEMVDRAIDFGIGSDRNALTRGVTLNSHQRPDGRYEWIHHLAHLPGLSSHGRRDDIPRLRHTLIRAGDGMIDEHELAVWREEFPDSELIEIAGPHNLHEAVPVELAQTLKPLID